MFNFLHYFIFFRCAHLPQKSLSTHSLVVPKYRPTNKNGSSSRLALRSFISSLSRNRLCHASQFHHINQLNWSFSGSQKKFLTYTYQYCPIFIRTQATVAATNPESTQKNDEVEEAITFKTKSQNYSGGQSNEVKINITKSTSEFEGNFDSLTRKPVSETSSNRSVAFHEEIKPKHDLSSHSSQKLYPKTTQFEMKANISSQSSSHDKPEMNEKKTDSSKMSIPTNQFKSSTDLIENKLRSEELPSGLQRYFLWRYTRYLQRFLQRFQLSLETEMPDTFQMFRIFSSGLKEFLIDFR